MGRVEGGEHDLGSRADHAWKVHHARTWNASACTASGTGPFSAGGNPGARLRDLPVVYLHNRRTVPRALSSARRRARRESRSSRLATYLGCPTACASLCRLSARSDKRR